jgi:DNA-binding transcriptional MerR regulator
MELSVGELAQRTGVTRRTIRYYVEIGLLPPPAGAGKAAVYGADHLERLETIKELQAYRLSLEEIRDRLAGKPVRSPGELPPGQMPMAEAAADVLSSDPSSAADYIARLRETGPIVSRARTFSAREPRSEYDAEQWMRISLSEDVELHVRRRASKSNRWLNRLIKEARRILEEEEVE